jgi:hypothetical protein
VKSENKQQFLTQRGFPLHATCPANGSPVRGGGVYECVFHFGVELLIVLGGGETHEEIHIVTDI